MVPENCHNDRFAVSYIDPEKGRKGKKRLYLYRGGLFAQQHEQTTGQHCQKFQALYEDVLANVRECLESQAGRKWPGCPLFLTRHAPGRPFCMTRLPENLYTPKY